MSRHVTASALIYGGSQNRSGARPKGFGEFISQRGSWRCSFCPRSFANEQALIRHTKEVHEGAARRGGR